MPAGMNNIRMGVALHLCLDWMRLNGYGCVLGTSLPAGLCEDCRRSAYAAGMEPLIDLLLAAVK